MVKVNCLNKISPVGLNLLTDNYTQVEETADANAILVRSAAMHDMDFSDNLAAIARAGAGVNNIPLDKCAEKGIVVFNTPGANANGVKELVICGMLMASRDIVGGIEWTKENESDPNVKKTMEKAKSQFAGKEIKGKKLGIIGLGAIGVLVANAANRLGMDVYGCDPFLSVGNALNLSRDIHVVKTREEIFKECDYITVHAPLLDDTKEMINKETIAMMKDGVIILNYARDLLVCEADMVEAVQSGKVAKYMCDFASPAFKDVKNIIATPHLGASTEESEDNCAIMAVNQVMDYIENGNIKNSVNYPACDAGICTTEGRITVNHKNVPNMLTQFTKVFAEEGINIENMVNKSRGEYSYSVFDICSPSGVHLVEQLEKIEGVLKVRIVK
ncbi:phosphoglycerate dehydrogenase [[Clostridium] polysaccharolyticum]|uniref:D-3-phosphoglycerate dehydrogenase n=1 Tax=[Clostridium] polysaccharolyticum TaxID=29364 RepID=A0A1I0D008_9FIRM|nr:phosphoglycerate dehydrogenase [[Clostridium] polysaccharolyticum]SET25253.1 D-3-phosphoglycerate dehydrogenase [[Clostridium] polysaccharolyticum]